MVTCVKRFLTRTSALAGVAMLCGVAAQASDISFLDSFRNISYQQTGNGNSLSFSGTFYSADLNTTVPNPYTSASLTYPGPGSPQSLTLNSSTDYLFQSPLLLDQATLDTLYPTGTYTYSGKNGGNTDTASYDYTSDDYAQSLPYLTGTDYSSVQGLNASQGFTFHISPFVTGSNASESDLFFTIFDETTNTQVFDAGFAPASTTSFTVSAGTFAPGNTYRYEIDFSNRNDIDSPGAEFDALLGFDVRTDGTFTTAPASTSVPEPSTAALFAISLLAAAAFGRRFVRAR